jgi:hypothetical protein
MAYARRAGPSNSAQSRGWPTPKCSAPCRHPKCRQHSVRTWRIFSGGEPHGFRLLTWGDALRDVYVSETRTNRLGTLTAILGAECQARNSWRHLPEQVCFGRKRPPIGIRTTRHARPVWECHQFFGTGAGCWLPSDGSCCTSAIRLPGTVCVRNSGIRRRASVWSYLLGLGLERWRWLQPHLYLRSCRLTSSI